LIVVALSFLWPLVVANLSTAHPLGNFSISQYSALRIDGDAVSIRYIVDMAEIPTFQEIRDAGIVANGDDPRTQVYLAKKILTLRDGLSLEINGRRLPLYAEANEIIFPPGAGGLPTLKIGASFRAKLPITLGATRYSLNYRDDNFTERAGWKEIVAASGSGAIISNSSVPETDRSAELSNYPTDLLNSPPQQLQARVDFTVPDRVTFPIAAMAPVSPDTRQIAAVARPASDEKPKPPRETASENGPRGSPDGLPNSPSPVSTAQAPIDDIPLQSNKAAPARDSFTELIAAKQLGWSMILIALAVAVGLGALHALEPGHGKTLVAAYLVGSRGTMKHALLLGLVVTAAHTAGVYLLGGITLYASRYIIPERLYPWLGVLSGLIITILGVVLVIQRYRGRGAAHSHHHHSHRQHAHDRDHVKEHDSHAHHHTHAHYHQEAGHKASLRELLTLGISGGIVPCPAALVVLLSALSMNRVGLGLLLIVAFSGGLAAVLIAVGLLMVCARQFVTRFRVDGQLATRWLPLTSSAFIILFGVALTWQALQTTGLT
jgi:ABC-type nickel/cobalt efflux system permease component RcnA